MKVGDESISRVTRSRMQAKKSYDRISSWYDLFTFFERKYIRLGIKVLSPQPGASVLEIGFGTGHGIIELARLVGLEGRVTGLDISDKMRLRAQKRLLKRRMEKRIQLIVGDAIALPFSSETFDAVSMCFTLELFDTPELSVVLAECARVLRSGGTIGLVAMSKTGGNRSMMRLYEWAHRKFPNVVDCRPIYPAVTIQHCGFNIEKQMCKSMFGLGVEVIRAVKN